MGKISYQRPREKLLDRGARALSNTELLQIIIGSGSQGISVARIAKSVGALLNELKTPLYQDLLNVRGMGHAKATQIIAAIELGVRFERQAAKLEPIEPKFFKIKEARRRTLQYITVDGTGVHVQDRFESIPNVSEATIVIRKMFANALHDYASSLLIGIGSRTQTVDVLNDEMLEIMKTIFDTASLLEINIKTIWLVSQTIQRPFTRKVTQ